MKIQIDKKNACRFPYVQHSLLYRSSIRAKWPPLVELCGVGRWWLLFKVKSLVSGRQWWLFAALSSVRRSKKKNGAGCSFLPLVLPRLMSLNVLFIWVQPHKHFIFCTSRCPSLISWKKMYACLLVYLFVCFLYAYDLKWPDIMIFLYVFITKVL